MCTHPHPRHRHDVSITHRPQPPTTTHHSTQRRFQKIFEEGPPTIVPPAVFKQMELAAQRLTQNIGCGLRPGVGAACRLDVVWDGGTGWFLIDT